MQTGAACVDLLFSKPCFVLVDFVATDRTCSGCITYSTAPPSNPDRREYRVGCITRLYRADKRHEVPSTTTAGSTSSSSTQTAFDVSTSSPSSNSTLIGTIAAVVSTFVLLFRIAVGPRISMVSLNS
jgi:hypothetical protein